MDEHSVCAPPIAFLRGTEVEASYSDPVLPYYRGNPIIEALPSIWSREEAAKRLGSNPPPHGEELRDLADHYRIHLARNLGTLFIPLPIHQDLDERISCTIRSGYIGRNPLDRSFWPDLKERVGEVGSKPTRRFTGSKAVGFAIVGISGIGKSTAVEAIFSLYHQLITHSCYQGQQFSWRQIVWLKLDCPHDGSVKGLCLGFFQAVDDILGTNYYENYARRGRATVDEMLPQMARVAAMHSIGVLAIDELQNLNCAKSGGAERMLNFFVQMVNTVGLPVILMGNYRALDLLRSDFRQARRSAGQGDLVWNRMNNDKIWRHFLRILWRFQYVRKPGPLTEGLCNTLYSATQGITDFTVKVFSLAQIRAIHSEEETITEAMIRSVAADSLTIAKPVLDALRRGDLDALRFIEDPRIDLEQLAKQEIARKAVLRPAEAPEKVAEANAPEPNAAAASQEEAKPEPGQKAGKSTRRKRRKVANIGLIEVVDTAAKHDVAAYQAVQEGGYIRPAGEFLETSPAVAADSSQ